MHSQRVENLNKLIGKASEALGDASQLLNTLINESASEEPISPEEEARYFQLILEYRLNNQDALVAMKKEELRYFSLKNELLL